MPIIFIVKELVIKNSVGFAFVDDEDFERLSIYTWFDSGDGIFRNKRTKKRSLAQEIIRRYDCIFDHKDRNRFNNQKYNLREATIEQNNANRGKTSSWCSSKYKGVCYHERSKKWRASVGFNKTRFHLGYFKTEREAAIAYNNKAIELFKEFVNLNIITD